MQRCVSTTVVHSGASSPVFSKRGDVAEPALLGRERRGWKRFGSRDLKKRLLSFGGVRGTSPQPTEKGRLAGYGAQRPEQAEGLLKGETRGKAPLGGGMVGHKGRPEGDR